MTTVGSLANNAGFNVDGACVHGPGMPLGALCAALEKLVPQAASVCSALVLEVNVFALIVMLPSP